MVKVITGARGSGKTRRFIDIVNQAVIDSKGEVVCVEKGERLRFEIKPQARLINTLDYNIDNFDMFYGFIAGLIASNHDITDIYVDGIFQMAGRNYDQLAQTLAKISKITDVGKVGFDDEEHKNLHTTTVFLTVSANDSDLPGSVTKYKV
jgi:hypothetical protein